MFRSILITALLALGCQPDIGTPYRADDGRTGEYSNEWIGELDEILWKVRLETPTRHGVAVDATAVFVVEESGRLVALALEDGSELWAAELGHPAHGAPVLMANRVLVGTDGGLVAVSREGAVQWTYDAEPIEGAPLVIDGVAYCGTRDGKILAVDAVGGSLIWEALTAGAVIAPGVRLGESVVFGSEDGGVYAVNRTTGEPNWTWNAGAAVQSVAAAGGIVYVSAQHFVAAIQNDDPQSAKWRVEVGAVTTPPTLAGSLVVVGNGEGQLIAVDQNDGTPAFKRDVGAPIYGGIQVVSDHVLVPMAREGVGVFDVAGQPEWKFRADGVITGIVPVDGRVYVTDAQGSVYALR